MCPSLLSSFLPFTSFFLFLFLLFQSLRHLGLPLPILIHIPRIYPIHHPFASLTYPSTLFFISNNDPTHLPFSSSSSLHFSNHQHKKALLFSLPTKFTQPSSLFPSTCLPFQIYPSSSHYSPHKSCPVLSSPPTNLTPSSCPSPLRLLLLLLSLRPLHLQQPANQPLGDPLTFIHVLQQLR